jgi:DNA-binding transcriptional ArsR family regulator
MMQGLVLDAAEPLYGRAAEIIRLEPILLGHLAGELGIADPMEAVRWHAVWGGLPRYWELAEAFRDLDTAVDRCVLDPLGPLHTEPESLLLEERPPAAALRPILDVIGAGAHRPTEIGARLGQAATALARPLSRLTGMGLVAREIPFGAPEKSGKRALYKFADPFCRFWFRVVAPHRALLAQAPARTRIALWRKHRERLFAEAWEELCRSHVARIPENDVQLGKLGPWLPARRFWKGNGPEWDVVSRSLDGRHLLLGEVKWSGGKVSAARLSRHAAALRAKGMPSIPGCESCQPVHCLFVPDAEPGASLGMPVVRAADVLATLR